MVAFLREQGLEGATMLEVGGGVGEIQIELLQLGVERAVNLELSPAYEHEAEQLLEERGLGERVERQLRDIAVDPEGVASADIVVLHRVVCCYPDYERLLGAVAQHTRRLVVFSYPTRNAASRFLVGVQNLVFRALRKEFRAFVHPPGAMMAALEERGLHRTFAHAGPVWHVAGLVRPAGTA